MQILFSEVPSGYDTDNTYEFEGKFYYYSIELRKEEFSITDTCGRHIPFTLEDTRDLQRAIVVAYHYISPITLFFEKINSGEVRVV